MGRRNKLQKFADLLTFQNVYQNYRYQDPQLRHINGEGVERKGNWSSLHFANDNPIILELACGWGEYTLALAQQNTRINYIGVDVKGNRIWKGAKTGLVENLHNAAFLRTRIEQIDLFFAAEEVSEIWITFPDPFLKKGKENRRLTAPSFLKKYYHILKRSGRLYLKTDSPELFNYSKDTLEESSFFVIGVKEEDIYSLEVLPHPALSILTKYEKMHLKEQKKIKYIMARKK